MTRRITTEGRQALLFAGQAALAQRKILPRPSATSVGKILDRLCFGVVVTKQEDVALIKAGLNAKMPDDWNGEDVCARYKKVGIEVNDVAA